MWEELAATVMHAMPGISLDRIEAMAWHDLVRWWGHARELLEGPGTEEEP